MECKICGTEVKYRDSVKRIKKIKYGIKTFIRIPRYFCPKCKTLKRYLPDDLIRMKHYEKEIILGIKQGLITSDTLGFEDYPTEQTMKRWRDSQNLQFFL